MKDIHDKDLWDSFGDEVIKLMKKYRDLQNAKDDAREAMQLQQQHQTPLGGAIPICMTFRTLALHLP